ncbi:MAG: PstS family phosphate ABC transporter substrate-binding protein [Alistipes sp.]|nr:PstS family phosphate ABC transporter substrate-binding protein [Alistipes sp.]
MKHSLRILSAAAVVLLTLSCGGRTADSKDGLKGEISLSGAFALYPLAVQWAAEFQQANPGVHIDISAGGAGKGMTDALAGVVDFGMVSREVYPPETAKGAVGFAVAKDAVAPTINAANPKLAELLAHGLTREAAIRIWVTGEAKTWGDVLGTDDKTPLHAYTRSDACGAAETWAMWLGTKQEELAGTAVFGDPGVAAAVQKDIYAIGLNNIGYIYDNDTHRPNAGLCVLPIDSDGDGTVSPEENFYSTKEQFVDAIAADRYPSPPARDLYLVSKGIPSDPAIKAFLKYILTEGQRLTVPAGYIGVSEEKVAASLELLGVADEPQNEEETCQSEEL